MGVPPLAPLRAALLSQLLPVLPREQAGYEFFLFFFFPLFLLRGKKKPAVLGSSSRVRVETLRAVAVLKGKHFLHLHLD